MLAAVVGASLEITGIVGGVWLAVFAVGSGVLCCGLLARYLSTRPSIADTTGGDDDEGRALRNWLEVDNALDRAQKELAAQVTAVLSARPDPTKPLPPSEIAARLGRKASSYGGLGGAELANAIARLHRVGRLPGISAASSGLFVAEDHINAKLSRNLPGKEVIAKTAFSLISDGDVICLDGGSTTLPLAELIIERAAASEIGDLTIVTNSASICHLMHNQVERRGWTDDTAPLRIVLCAGYVRPNTLSLAPLPGEVKPRICLTSLEEQLKLLHPKLAFVGANGIDSVSGITMPTGFEFEVKMIMLKYAESGVILADSTKLGVTHPVEICTWTDDHQLITDMPTDPQGRRQMQSILEIPGRTMKVDFPLLPDLQSMAPQASQA